MRWERTAWDKVELGPEERLRYALIAPRLVSPHGNRGPGEELRPDQALALAVQVRIANLQDYAERIEGVPAIAKMAGDPRWEWRLVGAFLDRVLEDDPRPLLAVAAESPGAASRAAAVVASACALLDLDRIDEALALLDQAIDQRGYEQVDGAWLEAQRARMRRQVGRVEEALLAARGVRRMLESVDGDPTADAIDAGAAAVIASVDPFEASAFEAAVVSGDIVTAWWRSQEIVAAGNASTERTFAEWARDTRVTVAREDAAANRLLAAELEATHAVDQGGWANRQLAIGRDLLMRLDRRSEALDVAEGLAALRRSGNVQALRLAVPRILADGPADAVAIACAALDLDRSTHFGAHADLVLLELGGDVLPEASAAILADKLLALAFEPTRFSERIDPDFILGMQVPESLGGVILAAGIEAQRRLISRVPELPPMAGVEASAWARLLWRIPRGAWTEGAAIAAARNSGRHDPELDRVLRGVAWRHGGLLEAREQLTQEASEGSLRALGELGDVTTFTDEEAGRLIARISADLARVLKDARGGKVGLGGLDPGEALAVLDLWHPGQADWDRLIELLDEHAVPSSMKAGALMVLARGAEGIPRAVRRRLRILVGRLSVEGSVRHSFFEHGPDLRGPALELGVSIGAVDRQVATRLLLDWLGEDAAMRRWAARIAWRLGGEENLGVLIALATDEDPGARATAAAALATELGEGPERRNVLAAVERAAREAGVSVPDALARALAAGGWEGETAARLREELRRHPSATVRLIASEDQEQGPGPSATGTAEPGPGALDNPYNRRRLEELGRRSEGS